MADKIMIKDIPVRLYSAESPRYAVLALHGFGGSKESVAISGLADRLCGAGCMIAAPDLPHHGERLTRGDELSVDKCVAEISEVHDWLRSGFRDVCAFSTSFGCFCLMRWIEERGENPFARVVLRTPALNMAASMLRLARYMRRDFSEDAARRDGFCYTFGDNRMCVPYSFYEACARLNPIRRNDFLNTDSTLLIYSEKDELVAAEDTAEFLRLNPKMQSLCIKGAGHRMRERPEYLAQALDSAAKFIKGH